jgi:hypothetical protein
MLEQRGGGGEKNIRFYRAKWKIKEDNKYCAKQIKYDYKNYFYSLNS